MQGGNSQGDAQQGEHRQNGSGAGENTRGERHGYGGDRRGRPHRDGHRENRRFGDRDGRRGPPRRDSRPRGDRMEHRDEPPEEPPQLERIREEIVLPGDEIGTTEEFTSGDLTYEKDGKIYSATLGEAMINRKDMSVLVKPRNPPNVLKPGDIVIGMVRDCREKMVLVTILKTEGNKRAIAGDTDATLQISQISKDYVETTRDMFHVGDLLRARVVQGSPSLQLSTVAEGLGVIRALCQSCRSPMEKAENSLHCEVCSRTESRKLAPDYGETFIGLN